MTDGTLFPLDQTAPENQNLLRDIAQCLQNPDMNRCQHLSSVAILKKKLNLHGSLHTILQVLEVNIVDKSSISQIVKDAYKQKPESFCATNWIYLTVNRTPVPLIN